MPASGSDDFEWTVVIAMVAVLVMKTSFNQIVNMVTMRHGFMAAVRAVDMAMIVADMVLDRTAAIGVVITHLDDVFIDMIAMGMMEVSIMQVVNMVAMFDGHVAAVGAMFMVVVIMMWKIAIAHGELL
ncbi:hypothetical protein [Agrobacterium rosae]|uniref:Uncharacterized protein n=1 Tax=Agrobacterium rosae TaxID=1972867 RepID=A0A1R3U7I2_9HYPH|nr:hypothetical protein [Agrobacterium rosae]SCX35583.1 hypothetical protein DSM25559_5039 [Agrobacterium rosae]